MATADQIVKKVLTELNKKLDSVGGVTDKWVGENGNWYRVYQDGWIEQGGEFTESTTQVVFPKPFTQPPKTIAFSQSNEASSSVGRIALITAHPTKTSMRVSASYQPVIQFGAYWFACGY